LKISELQNKEINIKRLTAQSQLYTDAKMIQRIRFLASGFAVTLLAYLGNILDAQYTIYLTLLSICIVLFDEFILNNRIQSLIELAATIQDEFDCSVLNISHNTVKVNRTNINENVQKYSMRFNKKNGIEEMQRFYNWYSGVNNNEDLKARIVCQQQNCWWNSVLQEKYITILKNTTFLVFGILIVISVFNDLSFSRVISSVVNPLIPMTVIVLRIITNSNKSRKGLNGVKKKLENLFEQCGNIENEKVRSEMRNLQDMIFDNRISTPLVPDYIYKKYRDEFEEIATEANSYQLDD